jgi:signal transduction histidine kinase
MSPIDLPWSLLSLTLASALLAGGWLTLRCLRLAQRTRIADAISSAARDAEASVTRILQLFAQELQASALTLRGHADSLAAERHRHAPSIASSATQLGSLADELAHHLMPASAPRRLACERVALHPLVRDAIQTISAAIDPGRRHWRIMPDTASPATLWADRRALRLVLVRVLGEAVRSSAQDDWIEIGWRIVPGGLLITVEDEGAGTATPGPRSTTMDSRGIGLRLSLARSLVQAHGGTLDVEALASIGTSVHIALPPERLRPDLSHAEACGGVV